MPDGGRVTTGSEPRRALTIAEDALRDIAAGDCMMVTASDGLPSIDTDAPRRVAEGALRRIKEVMEPGHDEQTEDQLRAKIAAAIEPYAMGANPWLLADLALEAVAERFKSSAPGGGK